jgi:hypothetical protein|tara:strand:+ start:268 stop:549 length:282 start_codon:yes stop_codon:yes gene_type:complete
MNLTQYSNNLTKHALQRKKERGFTDKSIELLLENCKEKKQKGGCSVIHFNKKGKKIANRLGVDPRMFIIFSLKNHSILTICHGYQNHRFKNYN